MNEPNKTKIDCEIGESIIFDHDSLRVARSSQKIKVPQIFDKDLAYLTGYHLGDGYLEDIDKTLRRQGKGGYEIDYADSDLQQIELIKNIINEKFGFSFRVYKRPNVNLWIARAHCKVLHWFLNKRLGIPCGRKKVIKIPGWIYMNKTFISNFLSGFFDAESDVGKNTEGNYKGKKYVKIRIQLTQKDINILNEIKYVLDNYFFIKSLIHKKSKQNAYILKITARNSVDQFIKTINFRNHIKKGKLDRLHNEIEYKQPRKLKPYQTSFATSLPNLVNS